MSQDEGESSNEEYEESPTSTPDVEFFPAPIEEAEEIITAKYLGSAVVSRASGIDVLNEAITNVVLDIELSKDALAATDESRRPLTKQHQNTDCKVRISPTSVRIEALADGHILLEARVRFISFMAICRDSVKRCGFILQTGPDLFEAHCFECEPNAGDLCKALEVACKLRYQKCLDAHRTRTRTTKPRSTGLSVNKLFSKIMGK